MKAVLAANITISRNGMPATSRRLAVSTATGVSKTTVATGVMMLDRRPVSR